MRMTGKTRDRVNRLAGLVAYGAMLAFGIGGLFAPSLHDPLSETVIDEFFLSNSFMFIIIALVGLVAIVVDSYQLRHSALWMVAVCCLFRGFLDLAVWGLPAAAAWWAAVAMAVTWATEYPEPVTRLVTERIKSRDRQHP